MTLAALALFAALGFADSKTLAVQIQLDRAGFSCSTIDGALRVHPRERPQASARGHAGAGVRPLLCK